MNVIIILNDSLQRDDVCASATRKKLVRTPWLDRLASRAGGSIAHAGSCTRRPSSIQHELYDLADPKERINRITVGPASAQALLESNGLQDKFDSHRALSSRLEQPAEVVSAWGE